MPGTTFEILDVIYEKFYTIRLKLRYNSLIEYQYENENRNFKNHVIQLGKHLWYRISQSDRDIIFTKLIDLFPNDHLWLSAVKHDAIACYEEWILEDCASAICSYQKSIKLWKQFSETDIDAINTIARVHNHLRYCCEKLAKHSYDQSKKYNEAVLINSTATNCDHIDALNRLTEFIYETELNIESYEKLNKNALQAIKYQE